MADPMVEVAALRCQEKGMFQMKYQTIRRILQRTRNPSPSRGRGSRTPRKPPARALSAETHPIIVQDLARDSRSLPEFCGFEREDGMTSGRSGCASGGRYREK